MIGDVSLTLSRRVSSARLEYVSLIGRGLEGVRRRLKAGVSSPANLRPPFNVSQTVEAVTVEFDVPGHGREGLILDVGPQRLRLQAVGRPRRSGGIGAPFDCTVNLPEAVDADQVKATLENGVVVVEMTKAAWTRGDAKRAPVRQASVPVQTAQEGDQAGAPKE